MSSLKNVVILCGTNKLFPDSPEEIADGILEIAQTFQSKHNSINTQSIYFKSKMFRGYICSEYIYIYYIYIYIYIIYIYIIYIYNIYIYIYIYNKVDDEKLLI